jgi:5-hydroxyisourate hydrolase-like protein (transthyretin family)
MCFQAERSRESATPALKVNHVFRGKNGPLAASTRLGLILLIVLGSALAAPAAHASQDVPWGSNGREDASAVTPLGRFKFIDLPARRVVYGHSTVMKAALVSTQNLAIPKQKVYLEARFGASMRWRRVTTSTTNDRGRVSFHTTLPASAVLRLRHPNDVVAAPTRVRRVLVAKRVRLDRPPPRSRVGMPLRIDGSVAPAENKRTPVLLQRQTADSWTTIGTGRTRRSGRFSIDWEPQRSGIYALRLTVREDSRYARGVSRTFRQRISPETTADIAHDILRNKRIDLERVHVSGGGYLGSAHQNIIDLSRGRPARRSCHEGAPCGRTSVDIRVLQAIRDMGTRGTVTISEIAGGVHEPDSSHYSGNALDVTWVNGTHVGGGSNYGMAVATCRMWGAKRIFTPAHDPYGGHDNHVHCDWKNPRS